MIFYTIFGLIAHNYQCGKLFAPFLHMNLDSICSRPAFALPAAVREKLRVICASTIDRQVQRGQDTPTV